MHSGSGHEAGGGASQGKYWNIGVAYIASGSIVGLFPTLLFLEATVIIAIVLSSIMAFILFVQLSSHINCADGLDPCCFLFELNWPFTGCPVLATSLIISALFFHPKCFHHDVGRVQQR